MSIAHKIGDRCERWGYSFQWTDQHPSKEDRQRLCSTFDELGDEALLRMQAIAGCPSCKNPGSEKSKKPDLYAILRHNHDKDEVLGKMWTEANHIPEWVDWEQLERGQKVWCRYAVANSSTFVLQAFIRESSVS
jgi:hypothetical protein